VQPVKRSESVASRGSPASPSVTRPSTDRKPHSVRHQSSPTPTPLHDIYHHHHHHPHQLGATSSSSSSYLAPRLPLLPPSERGSQHSPSPSPPGVVFSPVSTGPSSSSTSRFWKHSAASLGDLAMSEFGGCFAQRAAAAAAAAAGYSSYGVGTVSSGSSLHGLLPNNNGYSASPHGAPYYTSQVTHSDTVSYGLNSSRVELLRICCRLAAFLQKKFTTKVQNKLYSQRRRGRGLTKKTRQEVLIFRQTQQISNKRDYSCLKF